MLAKKAVKRLAKVVKDARELGEILYTPQIAADVVAVCVALEIYRHLATKNQYVDKTDEKAEQLYLNIMRLKLVGGLKR